MGKAPHQEPKKFIRTSKIFSTWTNHNIINYMYVLKVLHTFKGDHQV